MKICQPRRNCQAATLLEAVMATCVIAVMGTAIIGSINYGLSVMRLARENQRATQVMLEVMEVIRLYDWDQVTSWSTTPPSLPPTAYDPSGAQGQQGVLYYGTLSLSSPVFTATTPSYSTNMRQLTLNLQWTNSAGISHQRSFSTYISRDGLQNYLF